MWVDEFSGLAGHSLPAFLNLIQFCLNSFDKYFLIYLSGTVPSIRDTRGGHSSIILDLIKPVGETVQ